MQDIGQTPDPIPRWLYELGTGALLVLPMWGLVGIASAVFDLLGVGGIPAVVSCLIAVGPSFALPQIGFAPADERLEWGEAWWAPVTAVALAGLILMNDLSIDNAWGAVLWPAVILAVLSPAWPAWRWVARATGTRTFARAGVQRLDPLGGPLEGEEVEDRNSVGGPTLRALPRRSR